MKNFITKVTSANFLCEVAAWFFAFLFFFVIYKAVIAAFDWLTK